VDLATRDDLRSVTASLGALSVMMRSAMMTPRWLVTCSALGNFQACRGYEISHPYPYPYPQI